MAEKICKGGFLMEIVVIDGQGGKLGKQLVESIKKRLASARVVAVGTNSIATATMIKAGADDAATGENAVAVACRTADVIAGPIGIVVADSLLGEITPKMAVAVGQSPAKKILIPVNRCNNIIVGVPDLSLATLLQQALDEIIASIPGGG